MSFFNEMFDQKRRYRAYKKRIAQLPEKYRNAEAAFERYSNHLGGIGDGDVLLQMLEDLADLLEQAASDGTPIREIFGDDPVEFVEAFLKNYRAGTWITREQDRLRGAVQRIELDEQEFGR